MSLESVKFYTGGDSGGYRLPHPPCPAAPAAAVSEVGGTGYPTPPPQRLPPPPKSWGGYPNPLPRGGLSDLHKQLENQTFSELSKRVYFDSFGIRDELCASLFPIMCVLLCGSIFSLSFFYSMLALWCEGVFVEPSGVHWI